MKYIIHLATVAQTTTTERNLTLEEPLPRLIAFVSLSSLLSSCSLSPLSLFFSFTLTPLSHSHAKP